jgi:hypothetical protein
MMVVVVVGLIEDAVWEGSLFFFDFTFLLLFLLLLLFWFCEKAIAKLVVSSGVSIVAS